MANGPEGSMIFSTVYAPQRGQTLNMMWLLWLVGRGRLYEGDRKGRPYILAVTMPFLNSIHPRRSQGLVFWPFILKM